MPTYCRICGRPIEEGGTICEVCQENIRAEAMGRQKKIAREAPPKAAKVRIRERKGAKDRKDRTVPPPPQSEEEEKKPRDFKSMAEYLDYLKKKQ